MRRVWHVQVWNRWQAIGVFMLLCCLSSAQAQRSLDAARPAYRFGVFPYLPPVRVAELYAPAAACGTTRAFVRNFASRHAVSLRELAVTPAIPHVLFAVHERVPAHERESLLQVILGWQMTDKGRHFLASTGRQFFVKAEDADYHIVRAYAKRLQLTE